MSGGGAGRSPIRVAAVEDDPRYRMSLERLFRHSPAFELVATYPDGERALAELEPQLELGEGPDLVLMDLGLPGISGTECVRRLKSISQHVAVVMLTVFEDRERLLEAITAGADGYLLKRTPAAVLDEQLRAVVDGGSPLSAGVARTVLDMVRTIAADRAGAADVGLTPREREVLACLVRGMSYKAVGRELGISLDTVRTHIRAVYRKLQVRNVAEAVGRALRDRLV